MTVRSPAAGEVLVVDDDSSLSEMLTIVLRNEGFEPRVCSAGDTAMSAFREFKPDVVLLDLMLPGKDGVDVCREIRAESGVPIIMLTAKSDTVDVVVGLESGADDYVVKPFKPKELVARLRARLRKFEEAAPEALSIGDLVIDVAGHTVKRGDETLALTPLEFDLLVCLARKPWQVFTREVLLEQVWGYRHAADTRLVNVHVQRLRSKVEIDPENPQIVLTVRGVGYKAGDRSSPTSDAALGPAVNSVEESSCQAERGMQPPRTRVVDSLRSVGRVVVTPVRELAGLWRRSIQARVVIGTVVLSTVLDDARRLHPAAAGHQRPARQQGADVDRAGPVRRGDRAGQARRGARSRDTFDVAPLLKGWSRRWRRATRPGRLLRRRHRPADGRGGTHRRPPEAASSGTSCRRVDPLGPMSRVDRRAWRLVRVHAGRVRPTARANPSPASSWATSSIVPGPAQSTASSTSSRSTEQQQSLFVVVAALITTGALLVVLLGFVAWLVTRQVVTPVRLARRIAERLAAGRLEERMHVRGEDDIARLGMSFNQMAGGLQRQIRQLEELSRVQRRFVADVSHELRTPLTTVRMAADVLHDSRIDFDPATARSAELLQAELDRFEGLLTDLLEISRFDAGAAVLDLSDVDLRGVARRVVAANTALARASRLDDLGRSPTRSRRWPRSTYAGSSGSSATWSSTRSSTARGRRRGRRSRADGAGGRPDRARPRRRSQAGRRGPRLQPLLAGRPGSRPDARRHRSRPVHRGRGHRAALAGRWTPGASRAWARCSG